jgi:sugar O-acyltransferase (sialic acid O-acetyltransferase NeuD family)
MKKLLIFGESGTAVEIEEIIISYFSSEFLGIEKIFFDANFSEKYRHYISEKKHIKFIVGVSDSIIRKKCYEQMLEFGFEAYTVIHPSSVIFNSAKIGKGVYIGANVTISSFAEIGDFCAININSSIGHHAMIGESSIILPGARISGNCKVGTSTIVGSNAFLYQGITVGDNCAIDALTYLNKNMKDNMLCFSSKGKVVRRIFL